MGARGQGSGGARVRKSKGAEERGSEGARERGSEGAEELEEKNNGKEDIVVSPLHPCTTAPLPKIRVFILDHSEPMG